MNPIQERNRQILEMRKKGVSQREVARRFKVSASRVYLLERRNAADQAIAQRRAKLLEQMRTEDDPEKQWPANEMADAIGVIEVTKKRLLDHFARAGKGHISLREFMDMCLDAPDEELNFRWPPLMRVRGIGKKGFWSVVNGLTNTDLGCRCNQEWRDRLVQVRRERKITGPIPYSGASGDHALSL